MAIRSVTRAGVGLVVGIIILAALVFAGLWFVRERGEQAQRQEAINIAEEQLKAESDEEVAIDTNDGTASEESEESAPTSATGQSTTQPTNTDELPQTGPEAGAIVVSGLVTFAVFSYLRSRKLILE